MALDHCLPTDNPADKGSGGDLWVSESHHKRLKRLRSYSLQDFLLISDIKGTNMSFQWLFYDVVTVNYAYLTSKQMHRAST